MVRGAALAALITSASDLNFELLLVATFYAAVQGAGLYDVGAGAQATLRLHGMGLAAAWVLLAWGWPRLARA